MLEYCYQCNKDVKSIVKTEKNKYTYRGKEFFVIENIHYCPECNSELLNDSLDKDMYEIYDCYLKLFDLSFEKVKSIRKRLNLSQELFSKILGWSKKSIVRYENATSIPQGEYLNTYMILNENPYYIVKLLERQKKEFTEKEYYNILSILPFSEKYKTVNVILYLLKGNTLCETSLMKHLFAIDFYNFKENKEAITNLKYAHLPYGPVVENRNDLYNFLIKNDYIKIDINDNGTNFIAEKNFDEKLFSKEELANMKLIKDKFKGCSAKSLSEWSHTFKGYIDTKTGELISYKYASYLDISNI